GQARAHVAAEAAGHHDQGRGREGARRVQGAAEPGSRGAHRLVKALLLAFASVTTLLVPLPAQQAPSSVSVPPVSAALPALQGQGVSPGGAAGSLGPSLTLNLRPGATTDDSLSGAVELVLLMTLLALAPALVLTMTCFTRIVIV